MCCVVLCCTGYFLLSVLQVQVPHEAALPLNLCCVVLESESCHEYGYESGGGASCTRLHVYMYIT